MIRRVFLLVYVLASAFAPAQHKPASPPSRNLSDPAENVYKNNFFGFRYHIPYGWVDRTKELQGDDRAKGEVLLAIFERPPQARGDSVNSAVVIAAENASAYPGIKKAEDYLGPLTELTRAQGFKPDGDPSEALVDGSRLVRGDFTRSLSDKLNMHQTTLILLAKGKIVTFTFIGGDVDAADDLIDRLSFGASKAR
jgi:hypothetical protein